MREWKKQWILEENLEIWKGQSKKEQLMNKKREQKDKKMNYKENIKNKWNN